MLTAGSMLTPNLRLLRLLGRGGMGSVWLAEHLALGSEVAVKLLSSDLVKDEEALERFRREATAVATLKSPHVVGIHDFGTTDDGVPFFVMERLEGEDLSKRLDRVGTLKMGVATAIVVQTCKALARVHELGIVHRDLKPGNIFLTSVDGDLVVKLLDFGVAKMRTVTAPALHETTDQTILGTPLYMSPEQILSPKTVGFASDLYSLAVVVYECLVGKPPFDGETPGALHVGIVSGRYTPICTIDPSLPSTLDAWFAKALSSDPAKRFSSARAMADAFLSASRSQFALERLPVNEPMLLTPPRPMPVPASISRPAVLHTPRASTNSPSLAPVLAGVLVVLVLVGGILGATRLKRSHAAAAETEPAPPQTLTSAAVPEPEPHPTDEPNEPNDTTGGAMPFEPDEVPSASPAHRPRAGAPSSASAVTPPRAKPGATRRKNRGF